MTLSEALAWATTCNGESQTDEAIRVLAKHVRTMNAYIGKSITPQKAREIRRQYLVLGRRQCDIAAMYGISQGTVSKVVSGSL